MRPVLLGVLLAGADGVSYWATSRQRAQVNRDDQCQRYFIIYLHKFCYMDSISYDLYNFVIQILFLTNCIILQDNSRSVEDQPRAAEHPFRSGDGPSGHETEFVEDPSRHETEFAEDPNGHKTELVKGPPEVPRRRWTRKSHYVIPPPIPTNPESRPKNLSLSP
jgi:hypothetical protein